MLVLGDLTRDWKREHRIALIGAIALGAFVCFVFAFMHTHVPAQWWVLEYRYIRTGSNSAGYWDATNTFIPEPAAVFYLFGLTLWSAFGSIIGGAVVWITVLLRQ